MLCSDIDLGGEEWTPIGKNYSSAFKGSFDGQGHTVSGLSITGSASSNTGLFGYVDSATIENVTVQGSISLTGNGSSSYGAGGIAGRANLYPKTVAAIYDSFVAGDIARAEECQQRISTLQRVFKFGNPNTIIKKAVNLLGYPVGECRRPFNYLCDEGVAELKAVLKENEELGLC